MDLNSMNPNQNILAFLSDAIDQLDGKTKEFRAKTDPNKRKKGSKTDNYRRSADQLEEHKKMLLKIAKIVQKDPNYLGEFGPVLKDFVEKYLANPGSISLSKSLNETYAKLKLEGFKDILDDSQQMTTTKSETGGQIDSEPESTNGPVKDFLTRIENRVYDYNNISNRNDQKSFMEMFKASFLNRPTESDNLTTPFKKEKVSTDYYHIIPNYRMIEENNIPHMDHETLFFIFYYQNVSSQ